MHLFKIFFLFFLCFFLFFLFFLFSPIYTTLLINPWYVFARENILHFVLPFGKSSRSFCKRNWVLELWWEWLWNRSTSPPGETVRRRWAERGSTIAMQSQRNSFLKPSRLGKVQRTNAHGPRPGEPFEVQTVERK